MTVISQGLSEPSYFLSFHWLNVCLRKVYRLELNSTQLTINFPKQQSTCNIVVPLTSSLWVSFLRKKAKFKTREKKCLLALIWPTTAIIKCLLAYSTAWCMDKVHSEGNAGAASGKELRQAHWNIPYFWWGWQPHFRPEQYLMPANFQIHSACWVILSSWSHCCSTGVSIWNGRWLSNPKLPKLYLKTSVRYIRYNNLNGGDLRGENKILKIQEV